MDTKWKVPARDQPSSGDLRQLFAYIRTFGAERGMLLYPRAHPAQRDRPGIFTEASQSGDVVFLDMLSGGQPDRDAVRQSLARLIETHEVTA